MSVFYGRTAKDYKGEYRMQIQQQNFNSPAFQAIKLNTITKGARRIDIYSLGEQDRFFAEKMLNAAKGQVFPADSKILGGETVREVFDSAFKTAGRLGKYAHDRVFLAVENAFDKNYVSAAWVGSIYPAIGRVLKAGVNLKF